MERTHSDRHRGQPETHTFRRRMLGIFTAAALGLASLRSDGLPSYTSSDFEPALDVQQTGQESEYQEGFNECRMWYLAPERNIQVSELLEQVVHQKEKGIDTPDTILPSGVSVQVAKNIVWKVLHEMNIEELPINVADTYAAENISPLRKMNVEIEKPSQVHLDLNEAAQNLLPASFFTPLCDRYTVIFDIKGRIEDRRRDPFSLNLRLGNRIMTYSAAGSFYNASQDRYIALNSSFSTMRGIHQIRKTYEALETIVHELLHARQGREVAQPVTYFGNETLKDAYELDPYTVDMLKILGILRINKNNEKIARIDTLMGHMERTGYIKRNINADGKVSYEDLSYFGYSTKMHDLQGSIALSEFLPVASELYTQGKDDFVGLYGYVFGDVAANSLYDYMRDTFFAGREFERDEVWGIAESLVEEWNKEREK